MCDRVVSEDHFMKAYCPNEYKSQRTCDEAGHNCLTALKLIIPNWFVTSQVLENFQNGLPINDDMLFFPLEKPRAI